MIWRLIELHMVEIGSLGDFRFGFGVDSADKQEAEVDSSTSTEMCSSMSPFSASMLPDLKWRLKKMAKSLDFPFYARAEQRISYGVMHDFLFHKFPDFYSGFSGFSLNLQIDTNWMVYFSNMILLKFLYFASRTLSIFKSCFLKYYLLIIFSVLWDHKFWLYWYV